jgi:hypothetical protein
LGPRLEQEETKAPASPGEFKRAASPFPRNPDPRTRDPSFSELEAAQAKELAEKEASSAGAKAFELAENYKHYGVVTQNDTFKGKPMPTLPSQQRRPVPDAAPRPLVTRNESFTGKPKPILQSQGSMRLPDGKDTGRISRQMAKVHLSADCSAHWLDPLSKYPVSHPNH